MDTFNSLEELEAHNRSVLDNSPLGAVKIMTNEALPSNASYWERITHNSRPHEVFKLDWSSYGSIKWADTFLSYTGGVKGKALWMYDGAELFKDLKATKSKQFMFDEHKNLISLIGYTYPKGVLAENSKNVTSPTEHEVLTFMEVDQNKNIDIHFKFGRRFKVYLEQYFKTLGETTSVSDLEQKMYTTDLTTFKNFFNKQLAHYNMMSYILNTIGVELTAHYELKSDFSETQLKKVAKELDKFSFVMFVLNIFGEDIEIEALLKLYRRLLEDDMPKPKIEVSSQPLNGRKANYSAQNKTIYIWEQFIDNATLDKTASAELLIALVEEYGHFIDDLLRGSFATNPIKDTDYLDEGAKFAFFFFNEDTSQLKEITYAHGSSPYYTGAFSVSLDILNQTAEDVFSSTTFFDVNPNEELEGFGAGFEPGTHGGIELEALQADFDENEVLQIYYGNWLRDYSQVLSGLTVRITEEARKALEKSIPKKQAAQALKNHTKKISQEGWADLLEILAAKEFIFEAQKGIKSPANRQLTEFRKQYGKLTPDMLGLYRPEEHIDNPIGLKKEDQYPVFFNYEYPKGTTEERTLYPGLLGASLKIDDTLKAKNYIHKDFEDKDFKTRSRPSSATYLKEQIELAVSYGRNKDGFRHFGAALHVLEDYYAHTNFTELALIKAGNENVYPWVQGMQGEDYKAIPIVTGFFLTDDLLASIIPKTANIMFPVGFEKIEPEEIGDRTFVELFILELLEDLAKVESNEGYLEFTAKSLLVAFKAYLTIKDVKILVKKITGLEYIDRKIDEILQRRKEIINTYNNIAYNLLVRSVGDIIKDIQTHETNQNYGTNPTHTQIAKDAENHPLNKLSSDLAVIAVKDVGKKIKDIWSGTSNMDGKSLGNYIINTYFQHPQFTTWEEETIKKWAKNRQPIIKRLERPEVYGHSEQVVERTIKSKAIQKLLEYVKS